MLSEVYYLVRSQSDGRYLTARPNAEASGYLLLFRENYDALSYLNTHAAEVANRFAVGIDCGYTGGKLGQTLGFQRCGDCY